MTDVRTDGFGTLFATGATPNNPNGGAYSGGGGGGGVFVYREGEPSPNMTTVFPTFLGAYNAAYATGVPCTIVVDDTLGSCIIADNGNYDLHQITLSGLGIGQYQDPRTILFITDGVTWNQGFQRITNGLWIPISLSAQPFLGTLTSSPYAHSMAVDNGSGVFVSNSSALFDVSQSEMQIGVIVESGGIFITNGGSGPAFYTGGDGSVDIYLQLGEAAYIDSGFVAGSSGTLHLSILSDSVQLPNSFSFTGGLNVNNYPLASNLTPYSGPTNPVAESVAPLLQTGTPFFNTSSNQPVWWNGSQWVGAGGTFETVTAPASTLSGGTSISVLINTTGGQVSFALPDGTDGQVKYVISGSPTSNYIVLTLTHTGDGAIDLPAAGAAVLLAWSTLLGGWQALAFYNGGQWD